MNNQHEIVVAAVAIGHDTLSLCVLAYCADKKIVLDGSTLNLMIVTACTVTAAAIAVKASGLG
jgi:hypothetical protein